MSRALRPLELFPSVEGLSHPPLFRICLTGGPCGGKTTASVALSERLSELGWRVWRVPEAANILISGGMLFYNSLCWSWFDRVTAHLLA